MKKTFVAIMALSCIVQAADSLVTKDDFTNNQSGEISLEEVATSFSSGTFAVTFELAGSLTDGQGFSFTLGDGTNHSYIISFESSDMYAVLTFNGKDADGKSVSANQYTMNVPNTQGPFLLQVLDTASVILSYYDSGALTEIISLQTNGVLPSVINKATLTIGSTTAGSIASEIRTWSGEVTVQDIESPPAANKPIPEPTTATLSLLALAGLAARRRRASR